MQRQQVLGPEVKAEEESVAELKARLTSLMRDKEDLEHRFVTEQEYITNSLQRRIREAEAEKAKLLRDKASLENTLEAEQEYISNRLSKQLEALELEKNGMMADKLELRRQVGELGAAVDRLARDKVDLEVQFEREEEQLVNRLQRQLQAVTQAYCALEARLEAMGVSPRDARTPALDATIEWVYGRSPSRLGSGLSDRDRSRSSSRGGSMISGTPRAQGQTLSQSLDNSSLPVPDLARRSSSSVSSARPRTASVQREKPNACTAVSEST